MKCCEYDPCCVTYKFAQKVGVLHSNRLERLDRDSHTSLFGLFEKEHIVNILDFSLTLWIGFKPLHSMLDCGESD